MITRPYTDIRSRFRKVRISLRMIILISFLRLTGNAAILDKDLDAPIDSFKAEHGTRWYELCKTMNTPCAIEEDHAFLDWDKLGRGPHPALHMTTTSKRKILNELVRRSPGHRWLIRDGVLMMEPLKRVHHDILARKLDRVSIHGSSLMGAWYVLRRASMTVESSFIGPPSRTETYYGHVDLELRDVSVRDALVAIVSADGQAMWEFNIENPEMNTVNFLLRSWRVSGIPSKEAWRELTDRLRDEKLGRRVVRQGDQ